MVLQLPLLLRELGMRYPECADISTRVVQAWPYKYCSSGAHGGRVDGFGCFTGSMLVTLKSEAS
jgi:hypothetical protein